MIIARLARTRCGFFFALRGAFAVIFTVPLPHENGDPKFSVGVSIGTVHKRWTSVQNREFLRRRQAALTPVDDVYSSSVQAAHVQPDWSLGSMQDQADDLS